MEITCTLGILFANLFRGNFMWNLLVTAATLTILLSAGAFCQDDWQFQVIGTAPTPGQARSVAVYDDCALVADGNAGLSVFNITIHTVPIYVASYFGDAFVNDIIISDNIAYLAHWNRGVTIVDLSHPGTPDSIGAFDTPGTTIDLFISENLLYVADLLNGLVILDVSDNSNPQQVGNIPPFGYTASVVTNDTIIYISDQGYGLLTYSLGDTTNPILVDTFRLGTECSDIAMAAGNLYLACGQSGLVVFDLSDPLHPDSLTAFDTPGYLNRITITDTIAYLADETGGLLAVSINDPSNPSLLTVFNSPGAARGTATYNDFLLLVDGDSLFVLLPSYISSLDNTDNLLPMNFKITACFPNPFNSSTSVRFEIAERISISLDVYDIGGRLIINLAKGVFEKGNYAIEWSPEALVSGIYIIKISDYNVASQNGRSSTAKVTYLK